jgi:hypothetical protein
MKKYFTILLAFLATAFLACNSNSGKTEETAKTPTKENVADSLEKEVLDGHDIAMPKSMKIPNLQKEAKRLIDSIGKLPAKAQQAAAPLKAKLEGLVKNLDGAYSSMETWMTEFKLDSARNDVEQRIKYLTEEKLKVNKVKETVLGSIAKADSVLKSKF